MFEPIHGSAPKYKGHEQGLPRGHGQRGADDAGLSSATAEGAGLVENAISNALRSKKIPSLRAGDIATDAAGDVLVTEIRALAATAG